MVALVSRSKACSYDNPCSIASARPCSMVAKASSGSHIRQGVAPDSRQRGRIPESITTRRFFRPVQNGQRLARFSSLNAGVGQVDGSLEGAAGPSQLRQSFTCTAELCFSFVQVSPIGLHPRQVNLGEHSPVGETRSPQHSDRFPKLGSASSVRP